MPNLYTLSEYIRATLDKNYRAATADMFRQIAQLAKGSGSAAQRALMELELEAERLQDAGEPMKADNPALLKVLSMVDDEMTATQSLVAANGVEVQESGQSVAIPKVIAMLMSGLTVSLIAQGINPLSPGVSSRYEQAATAAGVNFTIPDKLDFAENYITSPAWIARMEGWGKGYSDIIADAIRKGLSQGWSPIRTAREARKYAEQIPLAASENITRTLQLTSYRNASAAMEVLNGQYIERKVRIAKLDNKTCFPAGTMIKTVSGDKKIENIASGEMVLTHRNRYQEVIKTMKRQYGGKMVEIKYGNKLLTCTADHPILVERRGNRCWAIAESIKAGDNIFVFSKDGTHNLNHVISDISVERSIRNSDYKVPIPIEPSGFATVSSRSLGMPVNTINLKSDILFRKVKINSIPVYFRFLYKWFVKLLKAKSNHLFWFCFLCALMITACAAVFLVSGGLTGAYPKFFTAVLTSVHERWPSTFFRAIMPFVPYRIVKFFTAPLANNNLAPHIFMFTLKTTIVVSIIVRFRNSKFFAAANTNLVSSGSLNFALRRAINKLSSFLDLAWSKIKFFTANNTNKIFPGSLLPFRVAVFGTTHIAGFGFNLGGKHLKLSATNSASFNNGFSIHKVTSSKISNLNYTIDVYNLEVKNDHTYLANGAVVHNCLACIRLSGTEMPLGETVQDHYRGRCDSILIPIGGSLPKTMQADSLPGQRNYVPWQTGEEWFAGLSPERQAQQASFQKSPAKYAAYKDGVSLSEFVGEHEDDVFGIQVIEKSLKQAVGDPEKYYAGGG